MLLCIFFASINSPLIPTSEAMSLKDYFDTTEYVVGLKEEIQNAYDELSSLLAKFEGKLINTVKTKNKIKAATVSIPTFFSSAFVSQVQESQIFAYIEPNFKFKANFVPNDPYWNLQWGPKKIRADYAWNATKGNHSTLVAVIDTGIDYDHPDLAANYAALGYDWVNNDDDPMDDHGHGTHCAGIIAAVLNNSIGIAGIAQVQIMAEKGLDENGEGTEDNLANAIYHAVDQGAKILSCSWGGYESSVLIYQAITYAYNHNVLIVAAAGNDHTSNKMYPAAYNEVIAVAATDQNDNPAWFSNYGNWIELAAPGVGIYSTIWDNSYGYMSGTSMACPHVAGVAALVWSQNLSMTRDELRSRLQFTADDLGVSGFDPYYGFGRINAEKAITHAMLEHDLWLSELKAPLNVQPAETALINATILNIGKYDETNIIVRLLINGSIANSTSIDFLATLASVSVVFPWSTTAIGTHNITCFIVPTSQEDDTRNNALSKYVTVRFPTTIKVPEDYATIQEAVDAAMRGDTVKVASGTYYENVVIQKPLFLIGENKRTTIVDGAYDETVLFIKSDNVTVKGFTIQHSGTWGHCGIRIIESKYCEIRGNVFRNNYYGMWLSSSQNCSVTLNIIQNNSHTGIRLDYCQNCIINGNFVEEHSFDGISLEFCTNCTASLNVLYNNTCGLWLHYCEDCIIEKNHVSSHNGIGIWLSDSWACTIRENTIKGNYRGIWFQRTPEIVTPTYFYHNNFIKNSRQILMEAGFNEWDDGYPSGGNYWSDYEGVDANGDGIGDSSYVIDANNVDRYPLMELWKPFAFSDVVVLDVVSPSEAYVGWTINVAVVVGNLGEKMETFEVALFYDTKLIETKSVALSQGQVVTLFFQWNTLGVMPYVNYSVGAEASMVLGETNVANNIHVNGFVKLKMFADVNCDKNVDLKDIAIAALAFGGNSSSPRWNLQADMNQNGRIDIVDIALIAKNFGKKWMP
ncbi:MAG: S8 family serine peptidase [Candidatus Bathyarchaeia archaeon]